MRFMFPSATAIKYNFCDCPCFCKKPLKEDVRVWHVERWRGKQLIEAAFKVCPACYADLTSEPWSLLEA